MIQGKIAGNPKEPAADVFDRLLAGVLAIMPPLPEEPEEGFLEDILSSTILSTEYRVDIAQQTPAVTGIDNGIGVVISGSKGPEKILVAECVQKAVVIRSHTPLGQHVEF